MSEEPMRELSLQEMMEQLPRNADDPEYRHRAYREWKALLGELEDVKNAFAALHAVSVVDGDENDWTPWRCIGCGGNKITKAGPNAASVCAECGLDARDSL